MQTMGRRSMSVLDLSQRRHPLNWYGLREQVPTASVAAANDPMLAEVGEGVDRASTGIKSN
jgi:hypothetical protein